MKVNQQSVSQFVRSKAILANYPTVNSGNSDNLQSIFDFVEKLTPEKVIIVCERTNTPAIQYVSANCKHVLGYSATKIALMPLNDFLNLIHSDDVAGVQRCFAHINSLEPYDPLLFRFELYYRFKYENGNYLHIRNEKITVLNKTRNYVYIALFSNIDDHEKFFGVKLNIYKYVRGAYKKISTYHPRNPANEFTPRQRDILELICDGLSNQEIANRLNISIHTVKNHKVLLFKKANAKNTVELATMASEFVFGG
jgi:DNA-binding CsgD family transcriptional regulator